MEDSTNMFQLRPLIYGSTYEVVLLPAQDIPFPSLSCPLSISMSIVTHHIPHSTSTHPRSLFPSHATEREQLIIRMRVPKLIHPAYRRLPMLRSLPRRPPSPLLGGRFGIIIRFSFGMTSLPSVAACDGLAWGWGLPVRAETAEDRWRRGRR